MRILLLGASYGLLLSTKLLMAGHDVTLACRPEEAALINTDGTVVRLPMRGGEAPEALVSSAFPGRLDASVPGAVEPAGYDLVALAMQEPQYGAPEVAGLLARIAASERPCLSIMNMPPPPYLRRIAGLDVAALEAAYAHPRVWDGLAPGRMSLCSPDPQAVRPPEAGLNVLNVGLVANFKAADFEDPADAAILHRLEEDIAAVRLDGRDVPVKLKAYDSLMVPLAKWSMLLTGNYRCVAEAGTALSIRDAVHDDLETSREIYGWVNGVARALGASRAEQVPFEKYAAAALGLGRPSSAARAIDAGAPRIERADKLVQLIGRGMGMSNAVVDAVVARVDARLAANQEATRAA